MLKSDLHELSSTFVQMDADKNIVTSFLIFPNTYASFEDYLVLLDLSEHLLEKEGYEGVYQLASFHPEYLFSGAQKDDPANYTNRSPYPMLHILREDSVSRAVDSFSGIDKISQQNIAYARKKGLLYLKALKDACVDI